MGSSAWLVQRMIGEILATGGTGQLATALARASTRPIRVVGRPEFDFDRPESLAATLRAARPLLVINSAAWTAVDAAETEPTAAARANAAGPGIVASVCQELGIPLIHISTDYVFDGLKGAPYLETDPTSPTGTYGATKLAGEAAVMTAHPAAVVLRTSWVYAETGKNFVLTMLNAAKRFPRLRVVADQIGSPTNADDLAVATLAVAERLLAGAPQRGVYHAAGSGFTSWHGFATEIFRQSGLHGWPTVPVDPIRTEDWPTPARRPADSRLECGKLDQDFGVRLPDWQHSLARAVAAICVTRAAAERAPALS